jgi:hypothetical protein
MLNHNPINITFIDMRNLPTDLSGADHVHHL